MKIVVAYRWAPDPAEASVHPDGTVDWGRAKTGISEYDPVAIELARPLADAVGATLVGVTVGGEHAAIPASRKAVLARGLDALHQRTGPDTAWLGTAETASVLAAMLAELGDVGLVLTGDASVDTGAGLVGPALAGVLGWPCLTDVAAVSPAPDAPGAWLVTRAWRGGTQTVAVAGPAVLAVTPDAVTPRLPGMRDIMAAGRRPVTESTAVPPVPAVEVVARRRPAEPERLRRLVTVPEADADAAASALVATLCSAGLLDGDAR